jgi:transposase
MAFLRIEKKKSGDYLRIVRSVRIDGKHTHETLYSLGKIQDYTPEQLIRIADKLKQAVGEELPKLIGIQTQQLEELGRYNYGYYLVYNRIFSYYDLPRIFERIGKKHRLSFKLSNAVLLMLIERLHDPVSKLGNYFNQQDYLGIAPVKLQHLYRSLDYLADNQKYLQQHIFQTNRTLFNQTIDVVFYDVTTYYFESEWEQEGALRQKGFSKDGKIGSTQVVFGLLIDKDKNPIGYQLYKGDIYEGHTFIDQVERLKKEYQIDRLILVADRGMLSQASREVVQKNGYEFILGERLKSLPKEVKGKMLDLATYELEWVSAAEEPVVVRYKTFKHEGRTIIVTYGQKRADKDKKERDEKIARAEQLIKHPSQLKNKARRFFLKQDGKDHYVLDTEKINNTAKYDGFLAITTNTANIDPALVLDHYHHLFQVEHAFRTFKSYLETRPMFHWTDKRIEGHICLCYLAYVLLNHLLQRLKKHKITEKQVRKILSHMQVSHIKQLDEQYYLRSKQNPLENTILTALGIKALTNIIPASKIEDYLR